MDDTYAYGHHDSLLGGHRWRTAENSAGYPLSVGAGLSLLDVGCVPGTITSIWLSGSRREEWSA